MSYTCQVAETLKDYNQSTFKMIVVKIIISEGKFEYTAIPIIVMVENIRSFLTVISGNQKELMGYFTVDAFTELSNSETVTFGYGTEIIGSIPNVNVLNPTPLPPLFSGIPYQTATNAWLQSL